MDFQNASPAPPAETTETTAKKGWDLIRNTRFRSNRCSDAVAEVSDKDIRQSDFFRGRSEAFVKAVIDFFQLATFIPGEYIMRQGEDGDRLVFLYRGQADVLVGAQEDKVASLESGKIVGEMALLLSSKRTCSVKATEFCECRVLDKHTFHRLLRKFPEEHAYFQQMARERREQLEEVKLNVSSERRASLPKLRTRVMQGTQRRRRSSIVADQIAKARSQARHTLPKRSHTAPSLPLCDPTSNECESDEEHQNFPEQESIVPEIQIQRKLNTELDLPLVSMLDDSENESLDVCPRSDKLPAKVIRDCYLPTLWWKGGAITPRSSSDASGWMKHSIPNYADDVKKPHAEYQQIHSLVACTSPRSSYMGSRSKDMARQNTTESPKSVKYKMLLYDLVSCRA